MFRKDVQEIFGLKEEARLSSGSQKSYALERVKASEYGLYPNKNLVEKCRSTRCRTTTTVNKEEQFDLYI